MKWLDSLAIRWLARRRRSVILNTTFTGSGIDISGNQNATVVGNRFIP